MKPHQGCFKVVFATALPFYAGWGLSSRNKIVVCERRNTATDELMIKVVMAH